jgi:hypothetical protein
MSWLRQCDVYMCVHMCFVYGRGRDGVRFTSSSLNPQQDLTHNVLCFWLSINICIWTHLNTDTPKTSSHMAYLRRPRQHAPVRWISHTLERQPLGACSLLWMAVIIFGHLARDTVTMETTKQWSSQPPSA